MRCPKGPTWRTFTRGKAISPHPTTLTVKAHRGDRKTLLAFDLSEDESRGLAGFTIAFTAPGETTKVYLPNTLQFDPADHQPVDAKFPSGCSVNAPFQKFRWLHVPSNDADGKDPKSGTYTYYVTPRFFGNDGKLEAQDDSKTVETRVQVSAFQKGSLTMAFTRGYVASEAFVDHFGSKLTYQPKDKPLTFDTSGNAGTHDGKAYSYRDEFTWMGYTAREQIFSILNTVLHNAELTLDVFAYDLNEPDFVQALLDLAAKGRVRLILDNASLHVSTDKKPSPEDEIEDAFKKIKGGKGLIKRGHFSRYTHDKVLLVRKNTEKREAIHVLTGSTNFSLTGMYVNSNHTLTFEDQEIAQWYADVFDISWAGDIKSAAFEKSPYSKQAYASDKEPKLKITFSPHTNDYAGEILQGIVDRINTEETKGDAIGSVLFAVMEIADEKNPVYHALDQIHKNKAIYSYGISDKPDGIYLYPTHSTQGVMVTGKPGTTALPPPFDQVPTVEGHQIHHKFVVCGFNRPDAVVYCGSSNLASGGEHENGDNLLAISDPEVATAFAIEALALVDHFDFLDRFRVASGKDKTKPVAPPAEKSKAANAGGYHLDGKPDWVAKYYTDGDLHMMDRQLFA